MNHIEIESETPLTGAQLRLIHRRISTPALIVIRGRLERNIAQMQKKADTHNLTLRPHIKTHKSVDIARMQLAAGATGIACAKLAEAEVMLKGGIRDIFIANQITQPVKIKRLASLQERYRAKLIIGIDHPYQVKLLKPFFEHAGRPLSVRIEIESGLQRCGVVPGSALINLAIEIKQQSWLELDGLFTHAGQVYGAADPEEIAAIADRERQTILEAAEQLRKAGIDPGVLSIGSTPAAAFLSSEQAVDELRPGNYVFYDGIQRALQVAGPADCSLFLLATVISRSDPNRLVIDAGSKALGLDRGTHSKVFLPGYGTPLNVRGIIDRLSEEHGIIRLQTDNPPAIGSPVLILPNHACAVANLFEKYYLISGGKPAGSIPVSARAKSQ